MNQTKQEGWEREFDNAWVLQDRNDRDDMKLFVKSLLSKNREEVLGEVREILPLYLAGEVEEKYMNGWNDCVKEIRDKFSSLHPKEETKIFVGGSQGIKPKE